MRFFFLAALAAASLGLAQAGARQQQVRVYVSAVYANTTMAFVGNNADGDWTFGDAQVFTIANSGGQQFTLYTIKYKGKAAYQQVVGGPGIFREEGQGYQKYYILIDIVSLDNDFQEQPGWVVDKNQIDTVDTTRGTYNLKAVWDGLTPVASVTTPFTAAANANNND